MTSRRSWLAAAAGASGLALAARVNGLIPPDQRGILDLGNSLSYAAHKLLPHPSARQFPRHLISPSPHPNYPAGDPFADPAFQRLHSARFADWRLLVDGLVARPLSLSLADLKQLPPSSHITQLACEEGWSYIAEWTGVSLAHVLHLAGAHPSVRFVTYESLQQGWWDSIDIDEARHPQTLLTYGMNGADLPLPHGAPLRLRTPLQLGYKSVKHLARLTLSAQPRGLGSPGPDFGFSWYAGI
jgi:DMSO/TMAO reductase YedYZ molybdopterin-dependent catalytic subunit